MNLKPIPHSDTQFESRLQVEQVTSRSQVKRYSGDPSQFPGWNQLEDEEVVNTQHTACRYWKRNVNIHPFSTLPPALCTCGKSKYIWCFKRKKKQTNSFNHLSLHLQSFIRNSVQQLKSPRILWLKSHDLYATTKALRRQLTWTCTGRQCAANCTNTKAVHHADAESFHVPADCWSLRWQSGEKSVTEKPEGSSGQ